MSPMCVLLLVEYESDVCTYVANVCVCVCLFIVLVRSPGEITPGVVSPKKQNMPPAFFIYPRVGVFSQQQKGSPPGATVRPCMLR